MSKLEKDLYAKRQAKIREARKKILEKAKEAKFDGKTNDLGTPVIPSYGLSVDDILKDRD